MKIKDQVCSLEPAKELEKLGVKQDSTYYWVDINDDDTPEGMLFQFDELESIENSYSAFTDAELEREIFQIIGNRYDFAISFSSTGGVWGNETFREMYEVEIIDWFDKEESLMERAGTGANAKAKMLIRLLKNNLAEK